MNPETKRKLEAMAGQILQSPREAGIAAEKLALAGERGPELQKIYEIGKAWRDRYGDCPNCHHPQNHHIAWMCYGYPLEYCGCHWTAAMDGNTWGIEPGWHQHTPDQKYTLPGEPIP